MTTNGGPRLELFGGAVLIADETRRPLTGERRDQLLVLLALHGGEWTPRDRVACLLWPDRPPSDARRNLRKVLFRAHDLPGAEGLQASENALRWAIGSDVADFRAALREGRTGDAVAAPFAPLCDGFDAACGDDFARWLGVERDALAEQWRRACAEQLAALESPRERAALARRALAVDPLDEGAVEALIESEMAQGHNAAARSEYLDFAARLAEALGVEPSEALRSLALPAGGAAPGQPSAPVEDRAEAFVGRSAELTELAALLALPDRRVVTVIGPGGIGKSRLVREASTRLAAEFADGTFWIELQDLAAPAEAVARLALRLGIDIHPSRDPLAPVLDLLRERRALVVFDNAEHLPALRGVLDRIAEAGPLLRLVVTSRVRGLAAGEVLLPLGGLQRPDEESRDLESAAAYDAVRLFERRARQARRTFALGEELEAVLAIVDAVEGMPLAIELAASWVRLLPASEIARDLAGSIDLLESDPAAPMAAQRPEHRRLRDVIERSFDLLAPRERKAMALLAVFKGGFDRAAALAVAAAPLPLLSSLVDKGLVASDGRGRFGLHPTLAAFAAERLAQAPQARAEAELRHAEFHARAVGALTPHLRADMRLLQSAIEADYGNIRAAWSTAVRLGRADLVETMVSALWHFFENCGRFAEGIALLAPALDLPEDGMGATRALARLRLGLATLRIVTGDLQGADALARRVIDGGEGCGDLEAYVGCLSVAGSVQWHRGRHDAALVLDERALDAARRHRDRHCIGFALGKLAISQHALGRSDEAIANLEEATAVAREMGNRYFLAANVCNLGAIRLRRREWQLARELLEEGGRLAREAGLSSVAGIADSNLGAALLELGSIAAARRHLGQAAERARQQGLVNLELNCERDLARAAIAEGLGGEARARLQRMLALARPDALASDQLRALAVYAELLASEGDESMAADAWRHALDQPQLDAASRAEATRRLAAMSGGGASPGSGAHGATLDDWVARIRAEPAAALPGNARETPGR